jgi:SEC-C motif
VLVRKVGRNSPCPCGSGQKFKRCHGAIIKQPAELNQATVVPQQVLDALKDNLVLEHRRRQRFGDIKGLISVEASGQRLVAVGNKMHSGNNWKTFHDFLLSYLRHCLGTTWWNSQIALPPAEHHSVFYWIGLVRCSLKKEPFLQNGLRGTNVGAASALYLLAYDLYLVKHNATLQGMLLRRLRQSQNFQGARFEATVAAVMLASGYELSFVEETGPGKHPEFTAENSETGFVLAVEAKSRHRPGVFGFPGAKQSKEFVEIDVEALVKKAVLKNPVEPLLIFVELNTPLMMCAVSQQKTMADLSSIWKNAQNNSSLSHEFPCIGIIFFNDASGWYLDEPLPDAGQWVAAFPAKNSKYNLDVMPILNRIEVGCRQRALVPVEFPPNP